MTAATARRPGRPGVTFEQYEAAYQELSSSEGDPPSQRQIRRYLGTGSNSTLSVYRRRIAEQRSEQIIAPEPGSLDEKLLGTVTQLVSQLSLDAAQVADDRVDEIQAEADKRIRIAETTMEKRLQDTALLEYRATTAEATIIELRAALTTKDKQLIKVEADLQSNRESHAALSQSLEDATRQLAVKTREINAQEQALELSRFDNKTTVDNNQKELDSIKDALGQSQAALATVTEQCVGLTKRLDERNKSIAKQNVREQELQHRFERSDKSHHATLTQLEKMRQLLPDLKAQLSARNAELNAEKRAHDVSTERLKSALMSVENKEALNTQLQKNLKELIASKKTTP